MNEREQYGQDRKASDLQLAMQLAVANACFSRFNATDMTVADERSDMEKVTDVYVAGILRVGLRLRSRFSNKGKDVFASNWNEATFRLPHEWRKVVEGKGDWMCYMWHDEQKVVAFSLIRLPEVRRAFRLARAKDSLNLLVDGGMSEDKAVDYLMTLKGCFSDVKPTTDGQNSFVAVDLLSLTKVGFNVIDATSDERLWTPRAELISTDLKVVRGAK